MKAAIKAEFRKLFTVRLNYFFLLLIFAIITLLSFYVEGIRSITSVHDPNKLANVIMSSAMVVSGIGAIISLLLLSNEYRYNTITYTLTATRSRHKVLIAKIVAITAALFGLTLIAMVYAPLMTLLGTSIKGLHLDHQHIHVFNLLWRALFSSWANAMLGLLFVALIRNQVAAIVTFFIVPTTVEGSLSILLRQNSVYLPFSALSQVSSVSPPPPAGTHIPYLPPGKAALVFLAYLVIGWIVAWYLFIKRDAT